MSIDDNTVILFQTLIDDIRYCKQQQWNTLYLTIITMGGLITVLKTPFEKYPSILYIAIILTALIGIYLIIKYQIDLERYRFIKDSIAKKIFSDDIKKMEDEMPCYCCLFSQNFSRSGLFTLLFIVIILSALAISILFIAL